MAKHEYKIMVKDADLICLKDGKQVQDWAVLKGENMPKHKLFVNGVGVATLNEVEIEGIEVDHLIGGFKESHRGGWTVLAVSTEKTVDPVTGEIIIKAKRLNGDVAITVLDKDGVIKPDKCRVEKA